MKSEKQILDAINEYKIRMKKEGESGFGYYLGILSALDWVIAKEEINKK